MNILAVFIYYKTAFKILKQYKIRNALFCIVYTLTIQNTWSLPYSFSGTNCRYYLKGIDPPQYLYSIQRFKYPILLKYQIRKPPKPIKSSPSTPLSQPCWQSISKLWLKKVFTVLKTLSKGLLKSLKGLEESTKGLGELLKGLGEVFKGLGESSKGHVEVFKGFGEVSKVL